MNPIDTVEWLANLETVWDLLDPNGLLTAVLNIMLSIVLLAVLASLGSNKRVA